MKDFEVHISLVISMPDDATTIQVWREAQIIAKSLPEHYAFPYYVSEVKEDAVAEVDTDRGPFKA